MAKRDSTKNKNLGEVVEIADEVSEEVEESDEEAEEVETKPSGKNTNEIEATGKFVVVEVKAGFYRMFNELGKAVSPVVSKDDMAENGKSALQQLVRQCSRNNALIKQRTIRTPKGHAELN